MKVNKVGKLFYGRFPYKIVFQKHEYITDPTYCQGWTVYNCRSWLEKHAMEHRMYTQILEKPSKFKKSKVPMMVKASLFLMTRDDVDLVMKTWPSSIEMLEEPFDEEHIDILKENTKTVIRKSLIYGKYKHIVRFRRVWDDTLSDVDEWISQNLDTSEKNLKWCKHRWNPTLYLSSNSDFFLVKMTWTDKISEIITILTVSDL